MKNLMMWEGPGVLEAHELIHGPSLTMRLSEAHGKIQALGFLKRGCAQGGGGRGLSGLGVHFLSQSSLGQWHLLTID